MNKKYTLILLTSFFLVNYSLKSQTEIKWRDTFISGVSTSNAQVNRWNAF